MLVFATLLSLSVPAFALNEPVLPSGGASVFIDDVRVEAGQAATATVKLSYDFDVGRVAYLDFAISSATTGISEQTPITVAANGISTQIGTALNNFLNTGKGLMMLTNGSVKNPSVTITVPNLSATTEIGLTATKFSYRNTGDTQNTKIDNSLIAKEIGSFIVQYPVTVTVEGNTPTGAAVTVNTTTYNGKATFDSKSKDSTNLLADAVNGTKFWVDSGKGQQNNPVLNITAPEGYRAQVKLGDGNYADAGLNYSLGEITATTNVSVKFVEGELPVSSIAVTDTTGPYTLSTYNVELKTDGTQGKTVAPKTYDGYTVVGYKLNNGDQVAIGANDTVTVDLNKRSQTIEFIYERAANDNSVVVPGPDQMIAPPYEKDNVTIKPTDSTKAPIVDGEGKVTVPEGGGSVIGGDGSTVVVPEGTVVDKDGNVTLPGTTGTIKPGQTDSLPAGFYKVTYISTEGTGKLPEQIAKFDTPVTTLSLPTEFQPATDRAFVNWNEREGGGSTSYEPGVTTITRSAEQGNLTLYAQWRDDVNFGENQITVTYHSNDGNNKTAVQVAGAKVDTTFTITIKDGTTFTLDGWTLAGWNKLANGNDKTYKLSEKINRTKAEGDLNLYAQWIKEGENSITVPGGDNTPGTEKDATANGSETEKPSRNPDTGIITVPAGGKVTTDNGKTEYPMPGGGTLKPDGTITITQPGGGGDIIVEPGKPPVIDPNAPDAANKKVIIITYESGVQGIASQAVTAVVAKDGGTTKIVNGETLFAREGYKFAYWKNANGDIIAVNSDQGESITLTANWYAVDKDGNITVPKQPDGAVVVKPDPTDPDKPDKKPSVDENGNVVVPPGGEVETKPGGGTTTLPDGGKVNPDGEIVVPNPDKPDDPYNPGKTIDPNDPATWPAGYYAVVYEKNGANATGTMAKQIGKDLVALANGFTNGDLKFLAWNTKTNGTGTGYKPGVAIPAPGADVTDKTIPLYAVWGKVGADGSITVPGKDGSVDPDNGGDNVTVKPGTDGKIPDVDEKGNITVPDGGTVKKEPDGTEITPPGGSVVTPGGEIIVPDPENPGGTTIDPNNPDSLPEGWYVVEYRANDGSARGTMSKQVSKDVVQAKQNRFELDGNTFAGWNTKPNGTGDPYAPGDDVAKPADGSKTVILYAQWRSSTVATFEVNVRFYKDIDHSETRTQLVTGTGSQTTAKLDANTFTLGGWSFLGWSTEPDGTGTFYANNASVVFQNDANTLELYAIWYKQDGDNIVIPGPDGKPGTSDDITVKPNPDDSTKKPEVNPDGSVKVPDGGKIEIPGKNPPTDDKTITVTPGATVKPDGTITIPDGGTAKIEPDGTTITGPAEIKPDGKTENPDPDKPYRPGDGTIVLPGKDGKTGTDDDVKVTPDKDGSGNDNSTIDKGTGNVTLPDGGTVKYPDAPHGNGSTVIVPGGTVIKPDGSVVLPDGKDATVVPGGDKLPGGSEIGPDGEVKTYAYTVKFSGVTRADEVVKIAKGEPKFIPAPAINGYDVDKTDVTVIGGELVDGGYVITFTYRKTSGDTIIVNPSNPSKPSQPSQPTDPAKNPTTGVTLPEYTGVNKQLETTKHNAYMSGVRAGIFEPNANMTRAQVARMFYNLLVNKSVAVTTNFSDVEEGKWYTEAVNALASLGIIQGSNGKFRPNDPITRAEFIAIAMRFARQASGATASFTDVSRSAWYYSAVASAVSYGWIGGYSDGSFRPTKAITRAEVVTIVNRMLDRSFDSSVSIGFVTNFSDVPVVHWAFAAIAEATTSHDHTSNNGVETWTK